MSIQGIGGGGAVQFDSISKLIGSGDMESVLLAFGVERAENMNDAVKAKIGDMRARNDSINELRLLMSDMRVAEPTAMDPATVADAEQLKGVGQQMAGWGSAGGRSWMSPDFKEPLDKFGIAHKASNMDKSAMSVNGDGSGGWHVSYPTSEYHQLGRDVQAKADTIIAGKDPDYPPTHIDLTAPTSKGGKTMLEVLEASGIPLPKGEDGKPLTSVSPEQLKTMMENLESQIDSLTTNDQLDMITLQSMVGKQNNALEMVSNLTSKFANLNDKIVGNMR